MNASPGRPPIMSKDRPPGAGLIERVLLGLLLAGIALGCTLVLWPFFSSLLWAAILVFSTWPVYERLRVTFRLRRAGAAAAMVALSAIVLVLPLAIAAPATGEDVAGLRAFGERLMRAGLPIAPDWLRSVPIAGGWLAATWDHWAVDLSALRDALHPYVGLAIESGFALLLGIANGIVLCLLSLVIAFFVYLHGPLIAAKLEGLVRRVMGPQAERLLAVTGTMVRGTVYSTLGTALLQGVLTAFGLWAAGVPRPVTLGAIVGFLSVLPIGAPVVWVPATLWLLSTGRTGAGIFLAAYGTIVITGTYYVVQPWLVARGAKLPFLLTALGVIGGALAFGLLGIFVGPVLLGVGYTLLNEWITPPHPIPAALSEGEAEAKGWQEMAE